MILPKRYNRNSARHARLLRRNFHKRCQPQGCTKQLYEVKVA